MDLQELIESLANLAMDCDGIIAGRGMGAVALHYSAGYYEWQAVASWSDNYKVVYDSSEDAIDALLGLKDLLNEILQKGFSYELPNSGETN